MNRILGFLRKPKAQDSPPHLPPLRRIMDELETIAEDTISRTPEIIAATPGASAESTFHDRQLPPLNKDDCPNFPPFTVRIEGLDSFATARGCVRQDPSIRGKVAVLNLASDEYRAGGWRTTLCKTQVRTPPSPFIIFRSDQANLNPSFPITTGRSSMLLIHPIHHSQERVLPLAKPRTRFRRRGLFPSRRSLQRRSRPLLRRSSRRPEGNLRRPHDRCASRS